MGKSALISLFAVLTLAAAAASSTDGDLLFVRALREKDPARRSEALLTLAEQKKYPAELALIHLTRMKLPPRSLARLLPIVRSRFGELVPTVLLVRAFRAEYDPARPEPMPGDELFVFAYTAWKNAATRRRSPFEQALFRELSGEVMALAGECGETGKFFPEVERHLAAHPDTWNRDLPFTALLEFCYRHAFRTGGFGLYDESWADSAVPSRRLFDGLLREAEKNPPDSDDDAMARMNFLLGIGKGDMALVQAAERVEKADGKELIVRKTHLIHAMLESGRIDVFQHVEPLMNPASVPLLKAQTLVAAGKADKALELLKRLPDSEQRELMKLRCFLALGEFDKIAAMAKAPASRLAADLRILMLLSIAEQRGDRECYDAAARLAGKKIDTEVSKANSFGYVALLLGLDRDLAEKRIRFALSVRPRESSYLDSLAWARHLAGDSAGAWKYMEKAIQYAEPLPENCELLLHAAKIRLALGDRDGARRYCDPALKLALAGEKDPKKKATFRKYVADIRKMLEQLK